MNKNKPKIMRRALVALLGIAVISATYLSQGLGPSAQAADEGSGALTMECNLTPERLRITMIGPVQEGVLETRLGADIRIEFGSDAYTWAPYLDGRNWTSWKGDYDGSTLKEYVIDLPADVGRFNLFLYDAGSGGEPAWFDVNQWTISGDCWASGGGIDYDDSRMADPAKQRITCDVKGDEMTVSIKGDARYGLFNHPPADQIVHLGYGGSDGWDPYDMSKARVVWSPAVWEYQMTIPADVQNMNFFLHGRYSGLTRWFDLDEWSVGGDCYRESSGDIRHTDGEVARLASEDLKISCELRPDAMIYRIEGPVQEALATDAPTGENIFLEYGGTDGWEAYTTGKPMLAWSPEQTTYELATLPSVDAVNFFLYSPETGEKSWFMLDAWNVDGDCNRVPGQDIRH